MAGSARDLTFVRFALVGGSMVTLYAILAALATSLLPIPRALSSAVLWIAFIPVGFWCHRHFTFPNQAPHRHGLWLYAATQGLGIAIAATVSWLFARGSFWHDVPVHFLAAALSAVASYAISRAIIFLPRSAD